MRGAAEAVAAGVGRSRPGACARRVGGGSARAGLGVEAQLTGGSVEGLMHAC